MPKGHPHEWAEAEIAYLREHHATRSYRQIGAALGLPHGVVRLQSRKLGLRRGALRLSVAKRFWPNVVKSEGDGCWEWTGYSNRSGYGRIHFRGYQRMATHVSLYFATGKLPPKNALVCHHCDNPPCVRPDHLYIGTHRDNSRDAVERGRTARGERVAGAVLTAEIVAAARDRYRHSRLSIAQVAEELGAEAEALRHAIHGSTWTHIVEPPPVRPGERKPARPHEKTERNRRIREMVDSGVPQVDVARRFGITKERVHAILNREARTAYQREWARRNAA